MLNYDKVRYKDNTVESSKGLTDFVLNNTTRRKDHWLVMSLLRDSKNV